MIQTAIRCWLGLMVGVGLIAVTTASSATPKNSADIWFNGSVEQAFAQAEDQNKFVLIYWGAVWCPPCNALKAEVFYHPDFPAELTDIIPVYLDGDNDDAQLWGEKFEIAGYPTVLLFGADGKERLRLATYVTFDEFREMLRAATRSAQPVTEMVELALADKLDSNGWQTLASTDWDRALAEEAAVGDRHLSLRWQLFQKAPSKPVTIRAGLASAVLRQIAKEQNSLPQNSDGNTALFEEIGQNTKQLLDAVLANRETIRSSRVTILFEIKNLFAWLKPRMSEAQYTQTIRRWEKAVRGLAQDRSLPAVTRLWAEYARIGLFKLKKGQDAPLPKPLRQQIRRAIIAADKQTQDQLRRHDFISAATYLYTQIGDDQAAIALLEAALPGSVVPWYLQLSLADIEEKRGNKNKALAWSTASRTSAQGVATQIQWTTIDLGRNIRLRPADIASIAEILRAYYELSFGVADGFNGRNAQGATRVAQLLQPMMPHPTLMAVTEKYRNKCRKLDTKGQAGCLKHFASLDEWQQDSPLQRLGNLSTTIHQTFLKILEPF